MSGTAEHFGRKVETRNLGRRIGIFDEMLGDLARSAADVQNPLGPAKIELSFAKHPGAEGTVQRNQTARGQKRSLGAVVNVLNLLSVLLKTHLPDQTVFQKPVEDRFARFVRTYVVMTWTGGSASVNL
jgi:hypothetical protein